jgi:hypothetical protein
VITKQTIILHIPPPSGKERIQSTPSSSIFPLPWSGETREQTIASIFPLPWSGEYSIQTTEQTLASIFPLPWSGETTEQTIVSIFPVPWSRETTEQTIASTFPLPRSGVTTELTAVLHIFNPLLRRDNRAIHLPQLPGRLRTMFRDFSLLPLCPSGEKLLYSV